jgi:hypothetical protein
MPDAERAMRDARCGTRDGVAGLIALSIVLVSCAAAPKPTAAAKRIAQNPPATIEGRVTDPDGRPVAGIGVRGIPRGEDIPWWPAAATDCDGRFRLSVAAPAAYGFLLSWKGTGVMTAAPDDPSMTAVPVRPGSTVDGVHLVFDAAAWRKADAADPPDAPSCP